MLRPRQETLRLHKNQIDPLLVSGHRFREKLAVVDGGYGACHCLTWLIGRAVESIAVKYQRKFQSRVALAR